MVPPLVGLKHQGETIRLRLPRPNARRRCIGVPPKRVDRKVKGIKGHANATHRGTLKWYLEDDTGLVHVMIIQGAYLIPDAATRILSPRHLAQQADDHCPKEEGTGSMTTSKNITLFWSQRQFVKTVPLDPRTNMGLTTTAAGTRSYRAYCATIETQETKDTNIFMTHVIPDDDDDSFQPRVTEFQSKRSLSNPNPNG